MIEINSSLLMSPKSANGTNSSNTLFSIDIFFLLPIGFICILGVTFNSLNITVFLNPKMKDPTFKYMLAMSISNLFYNGFLSYGIALYCSECSISKTYGTQVFVIFIDHYLTSCLAIFSNLVEIILSLQRYFILTNNIYSKNISYRWAISIIAFISFVFYLPSLFSDKIAETVYFNNNNTTIYYTVVPSEFGKSTTAVHIGIAWSVIRIILSSIILSSINILNVIEFRKLYKKRIKLRTSNVQLNEITNVISSNNRSSVDIIQSVTDFQDMRAKRNITLMVFWICALNFLGHLPRHIYIILKNLIVMSPILFRFNVFTFAILNLAQGMSFFINYSFNNMFRQTLIGYVRRIFFSRTQKT